jgi:hypothetical protein
MTGYYMVAAATALIAIVVWRRPWRRRDDDLIVVESWLESFSPDGYLPMLRLTSPSDARFLSIQRGPKAAARYRHAQRQLLREYLRSLSRDFNRLHNLATGSALRARSDRQNSSLALVEEKMEFIFSMWSVETRILLDEIAPCSINLKPLLAEVDQLTARARETARRRLEFRVS